MSKPPKAERLQPRKPKPPPIPAFIDRKFELSKSQSEGFVQDAPKLSELSQPMSVETWWPRLALKVGSVKSPFSSLCSLSVIESRELPRMFTLVNSMARDAFGPQSESSVGLFCKAIVAFIVVLSVRPARTYALRTMSEKS